ncbi:MAG: acetyl-CoA carboxylase biotin carboxyl carrier protein subunit [Candidatus Asgardarchaeia archaeon]
MRKEENISLNFFHDNYDVSISDGKGYVIVKVNGREFILFIDEISEDHRSMVVRIGERRHRIFLHSVEEGELFNAFVDGCMYHLSFSKKLPKFLNGRAVKLDEKVFRGESAGRVNLGDIISPITGRVIEIKVKEGDKVGRGDTLLVIEAMKMQNEIVANKGGTVNKIFVNEGDIVSKGDKLASIS